MFSDQHLVDQLRDELLRFERWRRTLFLEPPEIVWRKVLLVPVVPRQRVLVGGQASSKSFSVGSQDLLADC